MAYGLVWLRLAREQEMAECSRDWQGLTETSLDWIDMSEAC